MSYAPINEPQKAPIVLLPCRNRRTCERCFLLSGKCAVRKTSMTVYDVSTTILRSNCYESIHTLTSTIYSFVYICGKIGQFLWIFWTYLRSPITPGSIHGAQFRFIRYVLSKKSNTHYTRL